VREEAYLIEKGDVANGYFAVTLHHPLFDVYIIDLTG